MTLALRALNHKERTESELAAWLAERGARPDEVEDVIARLAEIGALDDERYANRFAEDKRELGGWGPDRIARELSARGVSRDLIDAAVAWEGEPEQARRAARLLEARGADLSSDQGRNRALGLLARRGFGLEVGYEAVRLAERASRAA